MSEAAAAPVMTVQVLRDWDCNDPAMMAGSPERHKLKINAGDFGTVCAQTPDGCWAVFSPYDNPDQIGYVPKAILKLGVELKDDIPIDFGSHARPAFNPHPLMVTEAPCENVLHQTLRNFWVTLHENAHAVADQLPGMNVEARDVLLNANSRHYGDVIYRCMLEPVRQLMADGVFNPIELSKLRQISHKWPGHGQRGIYAIIYGNWGGTTVDGIEYQNAIYIGQTRQFANRDTRHKAVASLHRKNVHYRVATKAQERAMIPLLLEGVENMPPHFLHIAEFTMITLFQSWYHILVGPISNKAFLGRHVNNLETARFFKSFAKDIAARTG